MKELGKLVKAKDDFLDKIPWEVITPEIVRAFTPFIQGITWLALSKVDKRISAMNNLIAVAEIVPGIDLGLPKGIVLAAMYDKTDEALDMINQLAQALGDLPGNLKQFIQDQVDMAKTEIEEVFEPITEKAEVSWWEKRLRETGLFGNDGPLA